MIRYEWSIETIKADGFDLVSTEYRDTFAECLAHALTHEPPAGTYYTIALIRDVVDGLTRRHDYRDWAYVDAYGLPSVCEGGSRIPQRLYMGVRRELRAIGIPAL